MTTEANVPHSPEFFDQMRSCREAYRRLADAMDQALSVSMPKGTLLDIGCGTGCQTARLAEHGWKATGVDVFDTKPEPGFRFIRRDLLEEPFTVPFDAVICTETAEHIYEHRADRLVDVVVTKLTLRRLIWSAAPPGCEWEGHVNLQPHEYWLKKLRARRFLVNDAETTLFRKLVVETGAQHSGAPGNFFILERA